jgi:hypothetical protein
MTNPARRDGAMDSRAEVIAQLRQGRPLGEVAREYGVLVADLCRWIAETVSVFEGVTFGNVEVNDEIRRLRLENECLRKQRDFYRKAAGIVSSDSLRGCSNDAFSRGGDLI